MKKERRAPKGRTPRDLQADARIEKGRNAGQWAFPENRRKLLCSSGTQGVASGKKSASIAKKWEASEGRVSPADRVNAQNITDRIG
jgi:hypothetical protein